MECMGKRCNSKVREGLKDVKKKDSEGAGEVTPA